MSGKQARASRRAAAVQAAKTQRKAQRQGTPVRTRRGLWLLLAIPLAAAALYGLTALGKGGGSGGGGGATASHGSGAYPYAVGSPGPGALAPALKLPATGGGNFDLAAYRGKQVLLYFQEGLTCEPCWTQLQAIQKDEAKFRALGIDRIVSITTDPTSDLEQKVKDEGITIPVLSDQGAHYSRAGAWGTNRYQMQMMGDRNGHTFILIGKNGRIRWRADYGGAPKYTMYVPDSTLLAQLREGMRAHT